MKKVVNKSKKVIANITENIPVNEEENLDMDEFAIEKRQMMRQLRDQMEHDLQIEKEELLKEMKEKLNEEIEIEKKQIMKQMIEKTNHDDDKNDGSQKIKPGKKRKANEKLSEEDKPKPKKREKLTEEEKPQPKKKEKKPLLDPNFNIDRDYFYQFLSNVEKDEIKNEIETYLSSDYPLNFKLFFDKYPKISKSKDNISFVQNLISEKIKSSDEVDQNLQTKIQNINNFILNEYFTYKPTVLEVHFFPEIANEVKVSNMIRTAKTKLDIAIFTLTNDKIYAAIEDVHKRGVSIRLIADDEMAKCLGADVYKVALLGIPVKMDNSVKYHMHNKFCVIDLSVVITGSFNWTAQAVQHNQENILFFENKDIAKVYAEEFEKLWNLFTNVVTIEIATKNIEEEDKKKKEMQEKAIETKKKKKEENLKENKIVV